MNSDSIQIPTEVLFNLKNALSECQTQLKKHDKKITGQGEIIVTLRETIVTLKKEQQSQRPRIDGQLLANAENKTRNLQTNVNVALTDPGITDDERQLLNDLNKIAVQILVFLGRVAITVKSLGWIVPVLVVPIVALAWPNTAAWLLGGLGAMLGGGIIGTAGGVVLPIVIGGVIVYSTMTK